MSKIKRSQIAAMATLFALMCIVTLSAFIRWHFFAPPVRAYAPNLLEKISIRAKIAALGIEPETVKSSIDFAIEPYVDTKKTRKVFFNRKELAFLLNEHSDFDEKIEIDPDTGHGFIRAFVQLADDHWLLPGQRIKISSPVVIEQSENSILVHAKPTKFLRSALFIDNGKRFEKLNLLEPLGLADIGKPPLVEKVKHIEFRYGRLLIEIERG